MSVYFDYKVNTRNDTDIYRISWHHQLPLLAVAEHLFEPSASYVAIYDHTGERIKGINEAYQENNSVTALSWHPAQRTLVVGYFSGDIKIWNNQPDFAIVTSPHCVSLLHLKWSHLGTRLLSADQNGRTIGWKLTARGVLVQVFKCETGNYPIAVEFCYIKPGVDVNTLAKRAIDGDERALDMFSAWRPRTSSYQPTFNTDNQCCYIATYADKVYYIDENGGCNVVLTCGIEIRSILHHREKNILIVILRGISVCHYVTNSDGTLLAVSKVKLNGIGDNSIITWTGTDVLACSTVSCEIRFWHIDTGNSYVLSSSSIPATSNNAETFTSLCFHQSKGILCCGSNCGNVTLWKKLPQSDSVSSEENWEQLCVSKMKDPIVDCVCGLSYIAVLTRQAAFILQEHSLSARYNQQVTGIQTEPNCVTVYKNDKEIQLKTDLKIIGLSISIDYMALWSGVTIAVYKLSSSTALNVIGTFTCECEDVAIYEQSLVVMPAYDNHQSGKVLIYTFQGTIKQNLQCNGHLISFHLNNSYLVVATTVGMLQTWNLSRREAKVHSHPKDLCESISDFGEVISVRINCTGRLISMVVANSNLIPIAALYIWDVENDYIRSYKFPIYESNFSGKSFVTSHYWDTNESMLLTCETKLSSRDICCHQRDKDEPLEISFLPQFTKCVTKYATVSSLVSLFVSQQNGIAQHDIITLSDDHLCLLAVDFPFFITLKKSSTDIGARIKKIMFGNFDELSVSDDEVRAAIFKFSFHFTIGDLDSAFDSIRNINSVSVWTNLAKMCVKRKRLDVARICLGNMKDARGVTVLKAVSSVTELNIQVAALALHLGMLEEAEQLYKDCGRYDLLNKLYQRSNRWDAALNIADKNDRIHLNDTYVCYARYMEKKCNINDAIEMYKRANSHRSNVPRILLQDPVSLQLYVDKSKDPLLMKWWAQYVESAGNMEMAIKYYERANDFLSIVRILCFLEETERAAKVAHDSENSASCYHLARHYENLGQIEKSVKFFIKSKAYGNAIRICKDHGLDDQLWRLALVAGSREQLDVANYFQEIDPYKAVALYQKANHLPQALTLAFKHNIIDAVRFVSAQLDLNSNCQLVNKCVRFFLENDDPDTAINLLTRVNKFEEAVTLCSKYHVNMTEELAELLTPPQNEPSRNKILNNIAEHALLQANYHLAAKKYTEAGNKVNAMKALLKSGDTEKIIFFANVSRERDIYIMAGNYLQTLDWQKQPNLLKHITNFYTKGKSVQSLANFYISCAQVEVDEYGNYEKCLGALNEASRCLSKDADLYGNMLEKIAKNTASVKKFLDIRRQFTIEQNTNVIAHCRKLLATDLYMVRKGDIYSLMVDYAARNNHWGTVSQLITEMKTFLPLDNLSYYITKGILQKIGLEGSYVDSQNQQDAEFLDDILDET